MLFNRDNQGSRELQQITGSFPASNPYSTIASEIDDATLEVGARVGDAIIHQAESDYESKADSPLSDAVRQAVAVLAVFRFSRNILLPHSDSGAKIHVDENEKLPFEWMVDRDEKAQRDRWYRSMDALYGLLERTQNQSWMDSDIRKAFKASIVRSLQEFERVYPVDGSYYVYYMLQNLVIESQPRIRRMVGDENWAVVTGESEATGLLEALPDLCRRYAVISALIAAVRRWSLEVFPVSIARRFSPSYQGNRATRAALLTEMDAYVSGLEAQLDDIRDEIQEVISGGKNPFEDFSPMPEGDRRNKFFSAQ